jgi:peptidoglycan hydrolase-like protein with peptidoglycan-binding domain
MKLAKGATAAVMAGAALLGLTGTASADQKSPFLGNGYANNTHAVWCVQNSINYFSSTAAKDGATLPYPIATIAEDGAWGPQTERAVELFQKNIYTLQVDGVVGRKTGDALIYEGNPYYTGYNGEWADGYCYGFLPTDF